MDKIKPKFKKGDKVIVIITSERTFKGAYIATDPANSSTITGEGFEFYGVVFFTNPNSLYYHNSQQIDLFVAEEHILPFNKTNLKIVKLLYGG